jgi:hypothetical protein
VFKFAGDAILVVWPPSDEDMATLTRRAAQCALEISDLLQGESLMGSIIVLSLFPCFVFRLGFVFASLSRRINTPSTSFSLRSLA